MAGDPAVLNVQGVHRPDFCRHRINVVKVGNYRLLVGDGDAYPADAHGPETDHGGGNIVDPKRHIGGIQIQGGKGAVMHGRAEAVAHRVAHDAVEDGSAVNLHRRNSSGS